MSAPNWYYGTTTKPAYVSSLRQLSKKNKLSPCPIDRPYVQKNQNVCFNCPSNALYNFGTQKCDSCAPGMVLDID